MIFYFAGNVGFSGGLEQELIKRGVVDRLLTYAEVKSSKSIFDLWQSNDRPPNSRLFLDSGAFSVDSRGATIDINEYCDFIKQNEPWYEVYAALDVIGDWRGTAKNLDIMMGKGLKPLPVFHEGSPWHELERLSRDYEYIALGRLQGVRQKGRSTFRAWLDEAFLRMQPNWPVKVHLFGITSQWVLERYPCYSADSSTAIASGGRSGTVLRFGCGRGEKSNGIIASRGWVEDVHEVWDYAVADHVSHYAKTTKNGSAHMGRRLANIDASLAMRDYINRLWEMRGIKW